MATTGTKSSGTDFVGLNDLMKQVYSDSFENNIESEMEVQGVFQTVSDFKTVDGPDGKQINLSHILSSGGGVGAMLEDDYFYTGSTPTVAQSSITLKQLSATVELSGRTLRRVKEGPAAFADWAAEALPRKAQRLAFHKDRMLLGTGTGIIGRISGTPDGTGDAITSAFGVTSLEGAINLFLRDDNLRYGPNANGSSLRSGTALVASIDYNASTFNTTVAGVAGIPTSAAASDYVFLGDANVQGIGSREIMGLEGIIDDATNVATFQGLARSSYPEMNAQIVDSTTSYGGVLSEELIDYGDSLAWERAGGKGSILLVNRNGQRSFWKSLKGDRVINDPRGSFEGGKASLKMQLGDRIVEVKAARKVPSSRAYLIDPSSMRHYKLGSGRWDDVTGSIWNRVTDGTGRKDAAYAVWIQEEEYACGAPAKNVKFKSLAAA